MLTAHQLQCIRRERSLFSDLNIELAPGEFLTQAEESGLIIPIGEWVLQTACEQLREWLDQGLPPIRISVNISEPELRKKDLRARGPPHIRELVPPMDLGNLECSSRPRPPVRTDTGRPGTP